ncbi:MAG: NADH:ubiquinone reductase (Na(+)-transporting) subunit F [Chromatiales bacterium]|nr:MAG: NADH:ubiquinone reductase (Na(+)-transporting) subunit F [Chromatiales bacterium]
MIAVWQELVLGAGLFTSIVMTLVVLVLLVRARILPGGTTEITVNGERVIQAASGSRLLEALASNDLFLPSPCGGSGTCGQCRVTITAGGGPLLPTEATHINRRDGQAGVRLACQVAVNRDLSVRIPEAVLGVERWECRVSSARMLAPFIRELVLEPPAGRTMNFRAGGYVQVECPPHQLRFADFTLDAATRAEWQRLGLTGQTSATTTTLTRAYSLANYPGEGPGLMLNVRLATPPPRTPADTPPGRVSSWLFSLCDSDPVTVLGPFGEFFARPGAAEMVFIGGGAGMAPLRSHILDQLLRQRTRRRICYWYGARSLKDALYAAEFEQLAREHPNFSWHLALSEPRSDDGWQGPTGFIHDVLREQYLDGHAAPEDCEYYLCGPPMMVAAVNHMLYGLGVEPENILFDDFGG